MSLLGVLEGIVPRDSRPGSAAIFQRKLGKIITIIVGEKAFRNPGTTPIMAIPHGVGELDRVAPLSNSFVQGGHVVHDVGHLELSRWCAPKVQKNAVGIDVAVGIKERCLSVWMLLSVFKRAICQDPADSEQPSHKT